MTNHRLLAWLAAAALFATACDISLGGLPQAKTGPAQTYPINVSAAGNAPEVVIEMAGGNLDIAGGASGLVAGTVETNVEAWKPLMKMDGSRVTVSQGDPGTPITDSPNAFNRWTLRLGKTPMALRINTGAATGKIELGGVPLRGVRLEQGAGGVEMKFSSANPEPMQELYVNAGAASISLSGLGNANVETLTFNGGLSNYTLDFGGKLLRNTTGKIGAGASTITLIVPEGMPAKATLSGGLRAANAEGAWQKNGDVYTLSGSGPSLTLNVEMGLGALFLKNK